MKKFINFRKSKLLLLTLLAFVAGASPTWAQKALPYSYGFEEASCSTSGWTKVNCHNSSENYRLGTSGAYEGDYTFRYYYTSNYPQYLISPELATSSYSLNVSFWYKAHSTSYEESFQVGYSTTDAETSSFTFGDEVKTKSTDWQEYTTTCPAGTKYICIACTSNDKYCLYIDDLVVDSNSPYKTPKAFASTGVTATTATFGWTAGGDETAWQIAYSTTEGFDSDGATKVDVTTNPYTLEGLTAETTYYARIRADYGSGNYSNWSDEISFKPSAAINTVVNNGTTENQYVPFHTNYTDGKIDKSQFIIPATSLSSIVNRQITKLAFHSKQASASFGTTVFKVYLKEVNVTSFENATFDYSDMEEVYSGTVSISGNEMAITLDEPFDYSGNNLKVGFEMTTKGSAPSTYYWYGITADGNASIYSYLYNSGSATSGLSSFLPKMTITSLPQSSAPKKPKNFDDSATTTTTATFGWTNGSDETAWQIAYSTDTDFDPDTEGTKVAATANPFTLTELTAATTYYAYVRAKKGDDYSAWSNKVEFTTLSAAPVMVLSTTSINFGLVSDAAAQAQTFTVTNEGGAAMNAFSVKPAGEGFSVSDTEGNELPQTIAPGESVTVKVTMNALGSHTTDLVITAGGEVAEQRVTLTGYMLDNTKILETFTALPSRWTQSSAWTYNATTGAKTGSSARTLTTPKIVVADGETLAVNLKLNYSSGYLKIEGSADNGETWTAFDAITCNYSNNGLTTSDFQLVTINTIPAGTYKLRLTGEDVYINVFNGFTYATDPVLGIFSNEACTTAQTSPATKNFGFATEAQTQTYYLKNTGNGQLDLAFSAGDNFTVAIADATLTEGESTAVTVTMPATEGLHEGTITVTAKNHDNDATLGTFVVNANGAVTGEKNNVVLTAFPAGWQTGNWAINSGAARIWSGTPSDLITTSLRVTEGDQLLVEAYKYYSDSNSQLSYSYSTDNGATWSDAVSLTDQLGTSYKIVAISGIPAGDVLMKFTGTYAYIRQIYGFEAVAEPIMTFTAADYSFGMVNTATTTEAYTIKNEGTAALENLSVSCDNANFEIAVADNATEIAANSEVTFTVTLKTTALGAQTGTVTVSGDGVTAKTFNVSGYVADGSKIFTDFASLPDRWTNANNYWSFSTSGATATNSSSKLESPKIKIAEGEKLAISAKQQYSGSYYYVTINGSDDNGATWTAYTKTLNNEQLNNTTYTVVELDDVPTSVNKLQLVGYYVYVNGLNGFTYDDNDPQLAVYSNEACTNAITATTATNAWGFVSEDKTATYYIKNVGTGTMTLTQTDAPAGFTAVLGKTSLGAGESTSLTIGMANNAESNEGYHAGDVVLTATDSESNLLGTFTVTSSGVVTGSKTDINFATLNAFPAGWEATNWTVTANTKATVGYTSGTLTTGTYTVAEGESLVIEGRGNSSWSAPTLTYQYSVDGGEWTTGTSDLSFTYSASEYQLKAISDIPAGDVIIKFTGTYVDIQRIYGYTAVAKANIALDKTADYDFGMQTADADYVITVTNNGTAAMTGLKAELTTADYEAVVSETTLAVGATATVTVTQKCDASKGLASLSDVLTISADGIAAKTISLSGQTRDASKWYADFASEIPSSFVEKGSWTVSSAAAYIGNDESSLISQPVTLAAGEKIQFSAKKPSYGSPSLKVRYSVDGGISWSDYVDYTADISSSAYSSHEIDLGNTDAATAIVEFKGNYYMYIDYIYGGSLNTTAPMIQVKKGSDVVATGVTEAFGSIKAETSATYTIKNVGNGTLTITDPITVTGDATAAVSATSLTNGQSATLTITMPVATPYGAKEGVVTVKTSLGDFVINYNATVLNPNALDEQFASGSKPAGWYFGGYWEVSSQQAENTASGVADLITEQLTVAGESDALTFQAARTTGNNAPTFHVYTSQNRVDWTEVDLGDLTLTTAYQDVAISGLAAGDYYVRISGARVKVDNFLGWTKKNNTHDLYVTSTTFPTATQDGGAELSTSVTVTSLIAAEEGVYAKLFINGEEAKAAEAATISLNGTQTFSMSYTLPTDPGTLKAQIKVYYGDDTEAFATAEKDVKVYYALDETVAPEGITAGTFDVKLTHEFVEGWNTVCLPFETPVSIFNGSTVDAVAYQFAGYDVTSKELTFTKVTTLEAGKPYVVFTPAGVESIFTLNDCEVTATEAEAISYNGVTFQGSYAPVDSEVLSGCYGLTAAGKIAPASATATMKGFRGYFTGVPANARVTFIGDETPTGISSITIDPTAEGVFNLNGQKVETLRKGGLYIVNGKKTVVK